MNILIINVVHWVNIKSSRFLILGFLLINLGLVNSCEIEELDTTALGTDLPNIEKSGKHSIAPDNLFSNGVNLQPSYTNGGDPFVNWNLMKSFSKIKTLRLEVDPINGNYAGQPGSWERNEDVVTKVRAQVKRANEIGLNVILTYYNYEFNGSDNKVHLLQAATWREKNYKKLRGSGSDRKNRSFRINLSNEWGKKVNFRQYYERYNEAISKVRKVYSYNIVIDCPDYGDGTRRAAMAFPHIRNKNITYSVHIYPNS